ncbi:MAG: hypothetical protein ACQUHE_08360 [Bacteroidia bacterium]
MKAKPNIPINNQGSDAIGGVYIVQLSMAATDPIEIRNLGVHRDEYFAFFALTKGNVKMECDTEETEFDATSIGFIKPFQVHAVKQLSDDAEGYFIGIAPFLIPIVCWEVFENLTVPEQGKKVEERLIEDFQNHLALLHRAFNTTQPSKAQIINGIFNSLIYKLANLFSSNKTTFVNTHKN